MQLRHGELGQRVPAKGACSVKLQFGLRIGPAALYPRIEPYPCLLGPVPENGQTNFAETRKREGNVVGFFEIGELVIDLLRILRAIELFLSDPPAEVVPSLFGHHRLQRRLKPIIRLPEPFLHMPRDDARDGGTETVGSSAANLRSPARVPASVDYVDINRYPACRLS